MRGTERQNEPHFGRIYGSLRIVKAGGFRWTVDAGDTYYAPTIGEYKFSNLTTPAVTFSGAAIGARSARTDVGFVAGEATVWRNIFGSDPDTLDQTIVAGRAAHHASDRLDVSARGSRIRTSDLDEFSYSIAASDQAGGGVRYAVTPSIQMIADGSVVWYRRVGSTARERDGSGLVGMHWLHSRGWLQVNASRFSPGESPTLNSPLPDRAGQFAAGEFDLLRRLRVFGGWEAFRSNLDPSAALAAGSLVPLSNGHRQFAGVRAQVGGRSTLTLRAEAGDRISKYVTGRQDIESDTGVWSADWQAAVGRMNGFLRVAQRNNVTSASRAGSYEQRDVAGQFFLRLSQSAQLFGLATATHTTDEAGGGNTFWQAGGGSQLQVVRQGLWMRTEATVSRNADLLTRLYLPRESFSLGFNGHVTPRTSVGIDIYLDHATVANSGASPWATRSIVRLIRTLPTGSPYPAGAIGPLSHGADAGNRHRQGEGLRRLERQRPSGDGREPRRGRPAPPRPRRFDRDRQERRVRVPQRTRRSPRRRPGPRRAADRLRGTGHFAPAGRALWQRHQQVAFGLIPLGAIRGRVVRDLNGNGTADSNEPAIDGAVVVLDEGRRSERSRRGQFAFEAVPSGEHTVTLLADSLPDGALIAGEATRRAALGRDHMAIDLPFLVSIETRAEIRKVFPGTTAAAPRAVPGSPVAGRAPAVPRLPPPSRSRPSATAPAVTAAAAIAFVLQVAAFDDPARAREMVGTLQGKGLPAYLVEPPPGSPNAPYRVRIGEYATRQEAVKAAASVGKVIGEKPWVTRDP